MYLHKTLASHVSEICYQLKVKANESEPIKVEIELCTPANLLISSVKSKAKC